MITHSTTDDNLTVTLIKDDKHKSPYSTQSYVLRDRKGKHSGTLCISSNGALVLTSAAGYKLTECSDS